MSPLLLIEEDWFPTDEHVFDIFFYFKLFLFFIFFIYVFIYLFIYSFIYLFIYLFSFFFVLFLGGEDGNEGVCQS